MRFLLDTDICSYAIRADPVVQAHVQSHRPSEVAISVITEAELRFGAAHNGRRITAVDRWLSKIQILDLRSDEAFVYAQLRSRLERSGTPIGTHDTWIAAHALTMQLVLVTNNEREFRRVPGLRVENWAA